MNTSLPCSKRARCPIALWVVARATASALLFAAASLLLVLQAAGADGAPALRQVAADFTCPVVLVEYPDESGNVLVADQPGVIYRLTKGETGRSVFLDLRKKIVSLNEGFDERGLLGLALHPQFGKNRKFYVYYSAPRRSSAPNDWDHTSRLSQFLAEPDGGLVAIPTSEKVLLEIDQPYFNHNGGALVFGPDQFLYVTVGDGGNAHDVGRGHAEIGNGQETHTLLGKILRLDVDQGQPYGIPSDNPFADGTEGKPEIYAYGFRNPWRISFDRGGEHELFAADVGQTMFEEVDIVKKGGNYGWNIREGFSCFDPSQPRNPPEDCPKVGRRGEPLIDPIVAYKNVNGFRSDPEALGISVTGGYVYRGTALPQLQGTYIFADWSRSWGDADGVILAARRSSDDGRWTVEPLPLAGFPDGRIGEYVVALGEDAQGELYVLTSGRNSVTGNTGEIHKLMPTTRQ